MNIEIVRTHRKNWDMQRETIVPSCLFHFSSYMQIILCLMLHQKQQIMAQFELISSLIFILYFFFFVSFFGSFGMALAWLYILPLFNSIVWPKCLLLLQTNNSIQRTSERASESVFIFRIYSLLIPYNLVDVYAIEQQHFPGVLFALLYTVNPFLWFGFLFAYANSISK